MYHTYEKEIGERLKTIRERKNYSQEQTAAKLQIFGCDICRTAVAKIESGKRHLYPNEIRAYVKAFNITYDDILG